MYNITTMKGKKGKKGFKFKGRLVYPVPDCKNYGKNSLFLEETTKLSRTPKSL